MYANDLGFKVTNEMAFLTTLVKEYVEEGVSVSVTLSGVGGRYSASTLVWKPESEDENKESKEVTMFFKGEYGEEDVINILTFFDKYYVPWYLDQDSKEKAAEVEKSNDELLTFIAASNIHVQPGQLHEQEKRKTKIHPTRRLFR